jgi:citrate lyase subunit beta/citryl-CoA lyase
MTGSRAHRANDEEQALDHPTIPPAATGGHPTIPPVPGDRCAAPPIRSLLFVPGHRERWVAPARASGADGVLFDLEDSVPAAELAGARRVVRRAVDRYGSQGPYLLARVAPPASPQIEADLDAVVVAGLHAVVLPLVQGPDDVRRVDDRLSALESARGMRVGSVIIVPLVETALAARFSYEIAVSSRRVEYMGAGTSRQGDIARALGYRWSAEGTETLTLRSWVLLNMRAAGLRFPITGLWGQVDDLDGCRRWVEDARSLGYTGTMAIHPSHIPIINEVFTPTADEVAHWERVVELMAARQAEGIGAFRLDGKMIDEADAKTAKQNLAAARQLLAGGRPRRPDHEEAP